MLAVRRGSAPYVSAIHGQFAIQDSRGAIGRGSTYRRGLRGQRLPAGLLGRLLGTFSSFRASIVIGVIVIRVLALVVNLAILGGPCCRVLELGRRRPMIGNATHVKRILQAEIELVVVEGALIELKVVQK